MHQFSLDAWKKNQLSFVHHSLKIAFPRTTIPKTENVKTIKCKQTLESSIVTFAYIYLFLLVVSIFAAAERFYGFQSVCF